MSEMKRWEEKVLAAPGAAERVSEIEEELRLAAGLIALRERAGLSQRELAEKIGVKQPRIAAIERSRNVTIDVLERYVAGLGGELELTVVTDGESIPLIKRTRKSTTQRTARRARANRTA